MTFWRSRSSSTISTWVGMGALSSRGLCRIDVSSGAMDPEPLRCGAGLRARRMDHRKPHKALPDPGSGEDLLAIELDGSLWAGTEVRPTSEGARRGTRRGLG